MADFIRIQTPKGKFGFTIISGKGKTKKNKEVYMTSISMPDAEAKPLVDQIEAYWAENKPKGAKRDKVQTIGYRPLTKKSDKVDEDGDPIYEEVKGYTEFFAQTGTTWPDGKQKQIGVYNAKGAKVHLGDKGIGIGSEGRFGANMGIYDVEGNYGINLYLEKVQLTKFVEYVADDGFDADEDEDGWTGDDDSFEGTPESTDAPAAGPRL